MYNKLINNGLASIVVQPPNINRSPLGFSIEYVHHVHARMVMSGDVSRLILLQRRVLDVLEIPLFTKLDTF